MKKQMLINTVEGQECRIAIISDKGLEELYIERTATASHVGNIYKGKITNVESAIQAAFVDMGLGKNGFLHISDVNPTYFPKGRKGAEPVGRKRPHYVRPPIQECLRRGQEVVVQMTKEGIGTKGPTMTTYLSVPGRLLVMMPGMTRLGVSRKVEDEDMRGKARAALAELKLPPDIGFIIRTAGIDRSKRDLQRDLNYLLRLWGVVKQRIRTTKAPVELYRESDLVTRTIRDVYNADIERIICDNAVVAWRVEEFLNVAVPRSKHLIEVYTGKEGLFHDCGVEDEIERIHARRVELPSGGSLIIDQAEALVAIDVNSGRFRQHHDAETTATKMNIEAAGEIVRQLRLRDLGGVIVIDFIDMREDRNCRSVEKTLRDAIKNDRAKTKVLRMSAFGIVELTRQRLGPSLKQSAYDRCPSCDGMGVIKSQESLSLSVMRNLQRACANDEVSVIEVAVPPAVAQHLSNAQRKQIAQMETESGKTIIVRAADDQAAREGEIRCTNSRGSAVTWDHPVTARTARPKLSTVSIEDLPAPEKVEGEGIGLVEGAEEFDNISYFDGFDEFEEFPEGEEGPEAEAAEGAAAAQAGQPAHAGREFHAEEGPEAGEEFEAAPGAEGREDIPAAEGAEGRPAAAGQAAMPGQPRPPAGAQGGQPALPGQAGEEHKRPRRGRRGGRKHRRRREAAEARTTGVVHSPGAELPSAGHQAPGTPLAPAADQSPGTALPGVFPPAAEPAAAKAPASLEAGGEFESAEYPTEELEAPERESAEGKPGPSQPPVSELPPAAAQTPGTATPSAGTSAIRPASARSPGTALPGVPSVPGAPSALGSPGAQQTPGEHKRRRRRRGRRSSQQPGAPGQPLPQGQGQAQAQGPQGQPQGQRGQPQGQRPRQQQGQPQGQRSGQPQPQRQGQPQGQRPGQRPGQQPSQQPGQRPGQQAGQPHPQRPQGGAPQPRPAQAGGGQPPVSRPAPASQQPPASQPRGPKHVTPWSAPGERPQAGGPPAAAPQGAAQGPGTSSPAATAPQGQSPQAPPPVAAVAPVAPAQGPSTTAPGVPATPAPAVQRPVQASAATAPVAAPAPAVEAHTESPGAARPAAPAAPAKRPRRRPAAKAKPAAAPAGQEAQAPAARPARKPRKARGAAPAAAGKATPGEGKAQPPAAKTPKRSGGNRGGKGGKGQQSGSAPAPQTDKPQ